MNLIMLGVVSLLLTCTFRFWRIVSDRELTFRLHQVQDELRWLAISDPQLREQEAFLHFDRTIGGVIGRFETVSFWTKTFSYKRGQDPQFDAWFAEFESQVRANERISALFMQFGGILIDRLRSRHVFLLLLVQIVVWLVPKKKPELQEAVVKPAFAHTAYC